MCTSLGANREGTNCFSSAPPQSQPASTHCLISIAPNCRRLSFRGKACQSSLEWCWPQRLILYWWDGEKIKEGWGNCLSPTRIITPHLHFKMAGENIITHILNRQRIMGCRPKEVDFTILKWCYFLNYYIISSGLHWADTDCPFYLTKVTASQEKSFLVYLIIRLWPWDTPNHSPCRTTSFNKDSENRVLV